MFLSRPVSAPGTQRDGVRASDEQRMEQPQHWSHPDERRLLPQPLHLHHQHGDRYTGRARGGSHQGGQTQPGGPGRQ